MKIYKSMNIMRLISFRRESWVSVCFNHTSPIALVVLWVRVGRSRTCQLAWNHLWNCVCVSASRSDTSQPISFIIWAVNVFPGGRQARRRQANKVNMLTNFLSSWKRTENHFEELFMVCFGSSSFYLFYSTLLLYVFGIQSDENIENWWKAVEWRLNTGNEQINKQFSVECVTRFYHFGFCICSPFRNMYSVYGVIASSLIFIHFQ